MRVTNQSRLDQRCDAQLVIVESPNDLISILFVAIRVDLIVKIIIGI
jgi:hypothetical protein